MGVPAYCKEFLLVTGAEIVRKQAAETIYWNYYSEQKNIHSLPCYVETNDKRLRKKYLKFIHDLGNSDFQGRSLIKYLEIDADFSYWWMTKIAEKSPLKSKRVYDCLRLFALHEILISERPRCLTVDSNDNELLQAIKQLCKSIGIVFKAENKYKNKKKCSLRHIYDNLPLVVQGLLSLRHLLKRLPLKRVKPKQTQWFSGDNSIIFFSYFYNLDKKSGSNGVFYSNQWGGLPTSLQINGNRLNWIHHYLPSLGADSLSESVKWINHFNQKTDTEGCHAFLESYLDWKTAFNSIKKWLKLIYISHCHNINKWLCNNKYEWSWMWPILNHDWLSSLRGPTAVSNCLWLELFDSALKDLPHQHLGMYLFEGQAWETALVYAWRKNRHGIIIGVPHTGMPFWYLSMYNDPRTINSQSPYGKPFPNMLAVNGNHAYQGLRETSFPTNRLFQVEAVRFNDLKNFLNQKFSYNETINGNYYRNVLIVGDYTENQTIEMLELVKSATSYLKTPINVIVKLHPACSLKEGFVNSYGFKYENDSVVKLVTKFKPILVFCSNTTSASIEVLLLGSRIAVYYNGEDFNHCPIRGESAVQFVSASSELASLMKLETHNNASPPSVTSYFNLDDQYPLWKGLIKEQIRI